MKKSGFCEARFHSMLVASTLTLAISYFMLLCDNILAGIFFGTNGVAAINAVTPITGFVSFFSEIISIGTGILYSREIGAMRKRRADEFFGQGLVLSAGIAVIVPILLGVSRELYFRENNITGEIYVLASAFYRWTPLYAAVSIMNSYLTKLVYVDGDERITNLTYAAQIVVNLLFSILLARRFGMVGIIMGTIIGNVVGMLVLSRHFFKKSNTLHFVWHFSFADLAQVVRYSIVDAILFLCWGVMDYIMIDHVSARYGQTGAVTLAVIIGLLEFDVVLDGVGMAVQPLIETYLEEKNQKLVRRLMRIATKTAIIEGIIVTALIFAFPKPFCFIFDVKRGAVLDTTVRALRIVSTGMVFCSLLSLITAYYIVVDRVALSAGIIVLKDGLLYSLLPVAASVLLGEDAMWAAFAVAPLLALIMSCLFIRLRYGAEKFPYLLDNADTKIIVLDDTLTQDSCARLSQRVQAAMQECGYSTDESNRAALFTEEMGLTILEHNRGRKKAILIEISLLFEERSMLLIERDTGGIFDLSDPDQAVYGLSSFMLSGLMVFHKERAYLTTMGYNRNMMRFSRLCTPEETRS